MDIQKYIQLKTFSIGKITKESNKMSKSALSTLEKMTKKM